MITFPDFVDAATGPFFVAPSKPIPAGILTTKTGIAPNVATEPATPEPSLPPKALPTLRSKGALILSALFTM
ncbi:Uncharacterised protein [Vibrio cholerae]|nr:Uncharacterised protein [Vibrio cholerae]